MKNTINRLSIATLSASCLLLGAVSTSSYAQYDDEKDNGFYVGANYGYLKVDGEDDFDDDQDAYQLLGGYQFNQYFALEGAYVDFGSYGGDLANADTDGFGAGIRLSFPLGDAFAIRGKLGQLWYDTDYTLAGIEDTYEDEGLYAGIGVSYSFTTNLAVTVDYTLYDADLDTEEVLDDIDDANFSTDLKQAAIGLEYQF
uniref:porin family protein n=1 Tax=Ningiella ruwaisensis TaxID=2364274 RepID=UPI00109FAD51|nr:porin family protein [Ningiella ruwaisensis]